MQRRSFQSCRAEFDGQRLVLTNECIERTWRVSGGLLYAESFRDNSAGRSWLARPSPLPSLYPPAGWEPRGSVECEFRVGSDVPGEAESLAVDLRVAGRSGACTYCFKLFPGAGGVAMQLITDGLGFAAPAPATLPAAPAPKGLEEPPTTQAAPAEPRLDAVECFDPPTLHARLVQVTLHDRTDVHDNLVFEDEWLCQPAEPLVRLVGNLFCLEDRFSGDGLLFLKHAPLPHARPVKNAVDLELDRGSLRLLGHGLDADGAGYVAVTLAYGGGRAGRIAALQRYQRKLRPFVPGRDGLLLSNTWGDRSKDSRINESFMLREIAAAEKLGVEVVQIDDGWQRGVSGNSSVAGGVWTGFWERDQTFWEPHPTRFPNGLGPVVDAARQHGRKIGLWYAPDSSNDFVNWQRDADQVLRLHREQAINYFKIDGVKMYTPAAERNLHRFYDAVLRESKAAVVFDHDVTAAVRPGYFGLMHVGPVFVENRYTDWHRYWPHCTLRNFWKLAQYVDPVRLRMEFLNNARNADVYGDDPLAPAKYAPDYLFATVMLASPLAWFEVSNLPEAYVRAVAPLIETWKRHRDAMLAGTITPIGSAPDGLSWTGFASHGAAGSGGYLLIFRELTGDDSAEIDVPMFTGNGYRITSLAGEGSISIAGGRVRAHLPKPRSFCWCRVEV